MARSDDAAMQLRIEANLTALEKAFNKAEGLVDGSAARMEKRSKAMAAKIEAAAGKVNVGKALEKVFDESKLRLLDEGSARISIFGSALEPLGPLGIAAAAGIAAVAEAFAQAHEAAEFAHEIETTAKRVHVTTDALQEMRFAIKAVGGEEKGADEALEGFSATLGKAQAGLGKAQRAFLELGFTRAQIKDFKDADSALQAVTERIAKLPNQQKDAVIDQLGLTGMKTLIEDGVDKMRELREEARKVGVVMDAGLVKRGAEAQEKFEIVAKVIDVQLKSALVDLAPTLNGLLEIIGEMARGAADIADSFRSINDKTDRGLKERLDSLLKQRNGAGTQLSTADKVVSSIPVVGRIDDAIVAARGLKSKTQLDKEIAATEAEMRARDAQSGVGKPPATGGLADVSGGNGPRDDSIQRGESVASAQAGARRAVLEALKSLTQDIEARANLEKQIIEAETDQKNAQINRQQADIAADKGISAAKQRELIAGFDAVKADEARAAELQKQAVDQAARQALIAQQVDNDKALNGLLEEELQIRTGMATTLRERRKLELQLLYNRQADESAALGRKIAAPGYSGNADAERKGLADKQAAELLAFQKSTEGPIDSFKDKFQDLDTAMQNAAVDGLDALNSGIINLAENGGKAGDVLKNVLNKVLSDILNHELGSAESSIFSLFKGGAKPAGARAGGGPVEAGKLYRINERGEEGFVPGVNGYVVPHNVMSGLSNLGGGSALRSAGANVTIAMHSTYELSGALGKDEIAAAIGRAHDSAAERAYSRVRDEFGPIRDRWAALKD